MIPYHVYFLMALGGTAGVLAGFFGIGGGLIIVPALIGLYDFHGIDPAIRTQMAVGTSLATILATGSASAASHHRLGQVQWRVVFWLAPFAAVGAVAGSASAIWLPGITLRRLFGLFELLIAVKMAWPESKHPVAPRHGSKVLLSAAGMGIGFLSSLFGIGGGTVAVPVLTVLLGMPIKEAIGTSAAQGVVIAAFGTLSYLLQGGYPSTPVLGKAGFIDPQAALLIGSVGLLGAPLGAWLNQRFPARRVRRAFAVLLAVVGGRLLFGA